MQASYTEHVRRLVVAIVGLTVIAALGFFCFFPDPHPWGLFMSVPASKDGRLVGSWGRTEVDANARYSFPEKLVLRADGTGEETKGSRVVRRLWWGTNANHLYTKRFSIDAWVKLDHVYTLERDGTRLKLRTSQAGVTKSAAYQRSP